MSENAINKESMLRVGTILHGTYRIDRYLSSGGFGNTYVATHINFDETYAVKEFFMKGVTQRDDNNTSVSVSNREKIDEFNDQREKFKKEARRLRNLDNQHIVRVHDLFDENGTAYYVMDYVYGENLRERLERTRLPLSEGEVKNILPQVLDALNEVHAKNIWHLDLKPANIMIDRQGTVKLIDFGASKQFNAKTGGATSGTAVSYTNGYAPREQMEQSYEKFGPWTDFYALGATIYNLLTNQRPPMPTDIDDDHSVDKHLALPLPSEVSKEMRHLILWMMKTDRLERPTSVQKILEFLDAPFSPTPGTAPKPEGDDVTVIEEGPIPPKNNEEEPSVPQKPPKKEKRRTQSESNSGFSKRIIITAIIVFLLAGGGYFLWNHFNKGKDIQVEIDEGKKEDLTKVSKKAITIYDGKCSYTGDVNSQGVPNGNGEAKFEDGRYYKGPFLDGNMHGKNAYFRYKEGDTFEGSFSNNKFEKGKYTIKASGESFVGTFRSGEPLHGKWYDKNGKLLETV